MRITCHLEILGILALVIGCGGDAPRHSYQDPEFGFSLEYPASWRVADLADEKERIEAARRLEDRDLQFEDRELFSAAKHVSGGVALRFSVRTFAISPNDYLNRSLEGFEQIGSATHRVLERGTRRIGEADVHHVRVEVHIGERTVYQDVFATEGGDGALLFGLSTQNQDDLDELSWIVESIAFSDPQTKR